MKIRELFEEPVPVRDTDLKYGQAAQILNKKGTELGSGAFGTAYSIPKDVDTVIKLSQLDLGKWHADGYYNYIEAIKDIKDNPYLPVVHEVVRMQPSTGQPYLLVNVEELVSAYDLNVKQLYYVLTRITGQEVTLKQLRKFDKWAFSSNTIHPDDLIMVIAQLIENEAHGHDNRVFKIIDSQLLEALAVISNLSSQGYEIDLHSENFMFRRTAYGAQMVLTDPLSFWKQEGSSQYSTDTRW